MRKGGRQVDPQMAKILDGASDEYARAARDAIRDGDLEGAAYHRGWASFAADEAERKRPPDQEGGDVIDLRRQR